jgi:hypothetical protein
VVDLWSCSSLASSFLALWLNALCIAAEPILPAKRLMPANCWIADQTQKNTNIAHLHNKSVVDTSVSTRLLYDYLCKLIA